MNTENQSDTALLMNLSGRAEPEASPPRPFRIRESIHCIRLIFGRFTEKISLRETRILLQHFQFNLITACMDLPVFCDEHGFHSVKTADQFQPFFKSHGEAGCAQGITVY